jgi:hypothetical protein
MFNNSLTASGCDDFEAYRIYQPTDSGPKVIFRHTSPLELFRNSKTDATRGATEHEELALGPPNRPNPVANNNIPRDQNTSRFPLRVHPDCDRSSVSLLLRLVSNSGTPD